MSRVVTYRRVSTEEQVQHGQSLGAQRDALRRWAEANGHELLAEFGDEGISAWDTSKVRPGLGELLLFCTRNPVDLVAVYSFDRFSRDLTQGLLTRRELERHGARVVSITEPADPQAPEGKLLISILGSFAQFFSDQNSAKTRASLKHKAAQGRSTGGAVPYGYRLKDGVYVAGPDNEVAAVRRIFELTVAREMGIKEIVKELNASGVLGINGARWSTSTVGKILLNRVYVGDRVWGKRKAIQTPGGKRRVAAPESEWTVAQDAHEPLIPREWFERRQTMATARAFEERKNRKRPGFWLLSGLLTCAHCGGGYTGLRMKRRGVDYRHYVCNTRLKQGAAGCQAKRYLNADELEAAAIDAIREEVVRPERLAAIRERLEAAWKEHRKANRPEANRRKLEDVQRRLGRLLKAVEEGVVDGDDARERMRALKADRARLEAELMRAGEGRAPLDRALAFIQDLTGRFRDTFDSLAFAERQELIRSIVGQIAIDQTKGEILIDFSIKEKGEEGLSLSSPWSVLAPQDGSRFELGRRLIRLAFLARSA
jgi:site-specific DNA recombinase